MRERMSVSMIATPSGNFTDIVKKDSLRSQVSPSLRQDCTAGSQGRLSQLPTTLPVDAWFSRTPVWLRNLAYAGVWGPAAQIHHPFAGRWFHSTDDQADACRGCLRRLAGAGFDTARV